MGIRQNGLEVGELIQIEVESLSYSAQAVGRAGDLVVFVSGAVPGDRPLVRITQIKKNYAIAEIVDVLLASPYRCYPPCGYFVEGCGGCQWQYMTYECQFYWKKEIVRQALKRIGKLEDIPEVETHSMQPPFHYRHKLRLFPAKYRGKPGIGMRRVGSHEVVPIGECLVSTHRINSLSPIFRGEIFSASSNLREIDIRCSDKLMLSCTYDGHDPMIAIDIDKLSHIPGVASVYYRIAPKPDRPGKFILGCGDSIIEEEVRGIKYKIGPECFFQINMSGLKVLVHLVREFAGEDNHLVLDAHCGVGTFALQMADICDVVWGTDISSPAVALARSSAVDNGIANAHFRNGTAAHVLGDELRDASIDLAILDPPRKGCKKADLQSLIRSQPRKVIYVSCNPTTLARDLHELVNAGYRLLRLAMVDMFPMTYHLEVVALCARRDAG